MKIFFKKISGWEDYFFDLRGYINKELSNLNIKEYRKHREWIHFLKVEFFYSYRRSRLNKEDRLRQMYFCHINDLIKCLI